MFTFMFKHPSHWAWYEWGKALGIFAPLSYVAQMPLFVAICFHVLCDFTAQSNWMAMGKAKGNVYALVLHSLVAAIPGYIIAGWQGYIVCAVAHYCIDSTKKFGINGWAGIVLDQLAHVAVLVALAR